MLMTVHSGSSSLGNAQNICSDFFSAQFTELLETRVCETLLLIFTGFGVLQIEHQTFRAS